MISGMSGASFAQQLIRAERMGKDQLLKNTMVKHKTQVDAYEILERTLKQVSRDLKKLDGEAFDTKTAAISDNNASISVTKEAPTGSYDLVVTQLAQAHQVSKNFDSEEAPLPTTGTLTIQVGPDAKDTLTLDMAVINASGTTTVANLAAHINQDEANPGVQASLVRTGGQIELLLSATSSGADSNIKLQMKDAKIEGQDVLGTDWGGMTERRAAQDAQVTLNGIEINSSSNTLDNVVDGISIELNKAHKTGETSRINIKADTDATEQAVSDFVDTFNDLMDEINKLTRSMGSAELDKLNEDKADRKDKKDDDDGKEDKKTSRTSSITEKNLGVLKGDSSIRMLQNSMRNSIFESSPSGMRLSDIGIEISRDGKLTIDDKKLTQSLKNDPTAVQAMFTDSGSYVDKINDIVKPFTESSGYLDLKQENLDNQISRVEDNMSRHNYQMQQRYQIYLAQFTAMEATVSQLNSASSLFY